MRSVVAIGILASALISSAVPSQAAFETGCCACLVEGDAHSGGAAQRVANEALFCALVEGMGFPEFVQRCQAQGGSPISDCPEPIDGPASCPATLLLEGIACPGEAAGAPTASPWMLAVLASALGAAGLVILRRRRA